MPEPQFWDADAGHLVPLTPLAKELLLAEIYDGCCDGPEVPADGR